MLTFFNMLELVHIEYLFRPAASAQRVREVAHNEWTAAQTQHPGDPIAACSTRRRYRQGSVGDRVSVCLDGFNGRVADRLLCVDK